MIELVGETDADELKPELLVLLADFGRHEPELRGLHHTDSWIVTPLLPSDLRLDPFFHTK